MEAKPKVEFDIFGKLAPNFDPHFVVAILSSDFYASSGLYDHASIAKNLYEILKKTKRVNDIKEAFVNVFGESTPFPEELLKLEESVQAEYHTKDLACGPLLDIFGRQEPNTPLLKELEEKKNFNMEYFKSHYSVTPEHLEALYDYAKFQFDCGNYSDSLDFLRYYRALKNTKSSDNDDENNENRSLNSLWGKLAADILVGHSDAEADLKDLQSEIRKVFNDHHPDTRKSSEFLLVGLQQRNWLLHWSLFVYAHPGGNKPFLDFMLPDHHEKSRDRMNNLNVIILTCPWLLRYVIACLLMVKEKTDENVLRTILRSLSAEDISKLNDPIVDLAHQVLGRFDFEAAQSKLADCASVIATDYFFTSMEITPEAFLNAARRFVFNNYCTVHQKIDLHQLSVQLHLTTEEAEKELVDMIRNGQIDAKLDRTNMSVQFTRPENTAYQQICNETQTFYHNTKYILDKLESLIDQKSKVGE